jgi:hypothetical protein
VTGFTRVSLTKFSQRVFQGLVVAAIGPGAGEGDDTALAAYRIDWAAIQTWRVVCFS